MNDKNNDNDLNAFSELFEELIGDDVSTPSPEDKTQIFRQQTPPSDNQEEHTRIVQINNSENNSDSDPKGDESLSAKKTKHRSKRTGCLGGAIYFVFVIATSALLAAFLWMAADDVLSLTKGDSIAEVTIEEGDTIGDITQKLHDAGLVRYKSVFRIYAGFSKAEEKIDPGTYTLSTTYDYRALVTGMQQAGRVYETIDLTIPEGYTVEQIFRFLDEKGVCVYDDLCTIAADYDFGYDFLSDIDYGEYTRLEGYLFPDTYQFYLDGDPVTVINTMLKNFDHRFDDSLKAMLKQSDYSMHEIITIASLIEKEVKVSTERELVASVIYNRLGSANFPYLQIDATVIYALGEHKDALSLADLEVDSPYNTYKYPGLPAGPISNPGIASIKAALNPAETNYYFYALTDNGSHHFSSTLDEHNAFLNQ